MKKEKWYTDGKKLIRQKTTDPTAALESAAELRSNGLTHFGNENWHVGRIDAHVFEKWVKEAGLSFSDRDAIKDLIRKKLLDPDNRAFRVHQGTF